jgi:integrase
VSQTVEEVSGHIQVVAATKTAASRRRFSIPTFLVECLSAHVAEHRPDAGPDDLLFVGAKGGLLRRSFGVRVFKPAVAAVGLPDGLTFDGLRHVAASLLVANGEHPKVIQARLGHADPSVSLGIYAHVSDDLDRAVGDRLGVLFNTSTDPTPEN